MFDIAYWILNNYNHLSESILLSLNNDAAYDFPDSIIDGLTTTASKLLCILLPFQNATTVFEADNCNSRMKKSQSGQYWTFLYSLTPLGRRELRKYPGITSHGDDYIIIKIIPTFLELIGDEKHNLLLENIKKDPSLYTEKGEILKKAFTEYKGKLAKYNNSMEIQKHNSDIETGYSLQFESPPRDLNLMNHNDNSSKNDDDSDSDYDFEDDDDYEDEDDTDENIPIAKENNNNSDQGQNVAKGPLAENLDILKEIASIK